MTRKEAEKKAQIIDFQGGYTVELVSKIYDDFEAELKAKDEAINELEEAMKPKTCSLCIFWDIARPRSHPNYAECNNRKCPLSYMEVHYEFGCKMFVPKETK